MKRVVAAIFVFAIALSAQENAAAAPEESMIPKWINFAILVGALGYLMMKTLPAFFNSRTAEIQHGIIEAQAIKKDAEKRAAEMQARMAALGSEIEKFRKQAAAEMEQEGLRVREETKRQIVRIEAQSQAEIETAGKIARRELQRHAARLALDLAEQRVRQQLDRAADSGLVDDFVKELEASKN